MLRCTNSRSMSGTGSSSPTMSESNTAFTRPALLPKALYTVSTDTPADPATAAIVVAAYPCSRNSCRAARSTVRRFWRACSWRPLASYERRGLTAGLIGYILLYRLQTMVTESSRGASDVRVRPGRAGQRGDVRADQVPARRPAAEGARRPRRPHQGRRPALRRRMGEPGRLGALPRRAGGAGGRRGPERHRPAPRPLARSHRGGHDRRRVAG